MNFLEELGTNNNNNIDISCQSLTKECTAVPTYYVGILKLVRYLYQHIKFTTY